MERELGGGWEEIVWEGRWGLFGLILGIVVIILWDEMIGVFCCGFCIFVDSSMKYLVFQISSQSIVKSEKKRRFFFRYVQNSF